jgi:transposase InsO family protein
VADHASRYPIEPPPVGNEDDEGRLNLTPVCVIEDNAAVAIIDDTFIRRLQIAFSVPGTSPADCKLKELYQRLSRNEALPYDKFFELDSRKILRRRITTRVGPNEDEATRVQLVIPECLRQEVLALFHDNVLAGHLGRNKTYHLMLQHVWWPSIYKDVRKYIRSCTQCQRHKPMQNRRNRLLFSTKPNDIWDTANIDLVGPMPTSKNGNKYICVITDNFSKWAEALPIPDKTETTVAEAIFKGLICRHSVPRKIITDQGTEFTNKLVQRLLERMNIVHKTTPPYYPQANGHVERFNRTLVESIAKQCEDEPGEWERFIDGTLFAYRVCKVDGLELSPFQIMFARDPILPMQILDSSDADIVEDVTRFGTRLTFNLQNTHRAIKELLHQQADARDAAWLKKANPLKLKVGDKILLIDTRQQNKLLQENMTPEQSQQLSSAKLVSNWLGPYTVTKILPNAVEIDDTSRKTKRIVALANVKKFYEREPQTLTQTTTSSSNNNACSSANAQLKETQSSPNTLTAKSRADTSNTPVNNTDKVSANTNASLRRTERKRKLPKALNDYVPSTDDNNGQSKSAQNAESMRERLKPYCVERILSHKRKGRQILYEVKWHGYSNAENSFIPEYHFDSEEPLRRYWTSLRTSSLYDDAPKRFQEVPYPPSRITREGRDSRSTRRMCKRSRVDDRHAA